MGDATQVVSRSFAPAVLFLVLLLLMRLLTLLLFVFCCTASTIASKYDVILVTYVAERVGLG